ncbi:hypothetical protein KK471_29040, partial [Klebsiella pneumoniae]|uniref:hypothetical protein n=1 Tax=Klebsiella pneumoniae TaxID=573 RepID=UPI001BE01FB8
PSLMSEEKKEKQDPFFTDLGRLPTPRSNPCGDLMIQLLDFTSIFTCNAKQQQSNYAHLFHTTLTEIQTS